MSWSSAFTGIGPLGEQLLAKRILAVAAPARTSSSAAGSACPQLLPPHATAPKLQTNGLSQEEADAPSFFIHPTKLRAWWVFPLFKRLYSLQKALLLSYINARQMRVLGNLRHPWNKIGEVTHTHCRDMAYKLFRGLTNTRFTACVQVEHIIR